MRLVAGGANVNNVLQYTVIVDHKKYLKRDNTVSDSFSELFGNDGIFTEIASESSRTGLPVLIDFAFVKDVNRTPTTKNSIIIQDDNLVKRLTLPIIPPRCEFERTLDVAYERFFHIYDIIDELVLKFTEPKNRLKEVQDDIKFFKDGLLQYIFFNSKENEETIKEAYFDFKSGIKYCNSHANEILSLIEQSTDISSQIVNIVYEFINRGASQQYYQRAKALNNDFGNYSSKSIGIYQAEMLMKYIKIALSHSYHTANEFISEYEKIIENLSIFDKEKPFDVLFKDKSSQDSYVKEVIDLTLIAVTGFGRFDRTKTIVNNKPHSNGACLYETSPRLEAELQEQIKRTMEEFFGNSYKDVDPNNYGNNGGNNGQNGPLF